MLNNKKMILISSIIAVSAVVITVFILITFASNNKNVSGATSTSYVSQNSNVTTDINKVTSGGQKTTTKSYAVNQKNDSETANILKKYSIKNKTKSSEKEMILDIVSAIKKGDLTEQEENVLKTFLRRRLITVSGDIELTKDIIEVIK